jgi:hypothetical protein
MAVLTKTTDIDQLLLEQKSWNDFHVAGGISDDDWISHFIHRTHKNEVLDFEAHPYLVLLYQIPDMMAKGIVSSFVAKKGTQAGVSEWAIWLEITLAIKGLRTFHVMPTYDLVSRFVRERVDRTVDYTPLYSAYMRHEQVKADQAGRSRAQSVSLKQFGKGTVAYVGSNSVAGFKEFVADVGIIDEEDECDQDNLNKVVERMAHSKYRWDIRLGNPSIPKKGITNSFAKSSKHFWTLRCDRGHPIILDEFKHLVRDEGEGNYRVLDPDWEPNGGHEARCICDKCGAPVNRKGIGEWVPENTEAAKAGHWGMHFSKLFTGYVTTNELLQRLDDGTKDEEKKKAHINGDLGLEYMPKGAMIDAEMLNACMEDYTMPASNTEPGLTLAGIDVGTRFNVWIARLVNSIHQVRLKSLCITDEIREISDLMALLQRYRVNVGVMDAMPETRLTKVICSRFRGFFACFYAQGDVSKKDSLMQKVLTVGRTAAIDQAKEAVQSQFIMLPVNAPTIPNLYEQVGNSVRVYDPEAYGGKGAWKWEETGPDHFLHALTYLILARNMAAKLTRRLPTPVQDATVPAGG